MRTHPKRERVISLVMLTARSIDHWPSEYIRCAKEAPARVQKASISARHCRFRSLASAAPSAPKSDESSCSTASAS